MNEAAASLPSRERGSKHRTEIRPAARPAVAPFAGAWIETRWRPSWPRSCRSLPSRERGSKRIRTRRPASRTQSLPSRERGSKRRATIDRRRANPSLPSRERGSKLGKYAIKADRYGRSLRGSVDRNRRAPSRSVPIWVAPFAGAWIETACRACTRGSIESLPSRERGSKPGHQQLAAALPGRRSLRGSVDRNANHDGSQRQEIMSLPSRERGSKPARPPAVPVRSVSLPSRERGSKRSFGGLGSAGGIVAPFAGAWIETTSPRSGCSPTTVAPFAGAWIET